MNEDLISVAQASRLTGASIQSLHFWIKMHYLPAQRIGTYYALKVSDVLLANERSLKNEERKRFIAK